MKGLLSMYRLQHPTVLAYMLQSTEYQAGPYLAWYWQTSNFDMVMKRRELRLTPAARLLRAALRFGMLLQFAIGFGLVLQWFMQGLEPGWRLGWALIITYPIIWAHLILIPLALADLLVIKPRQRRAIRRSERLFANHPGRRIAIVGSYGKTSMKELLNTVLSEGKKVAASPANKNVGISHAAFARQLSGDEDVLLIEYGEGRPGDVLRLARQTHPTHAVITGLAPAHLDHYKTLQAAGRDIFSICKQVPHKQLYVNAESPDAAPFINKQMQLYSASGALGWKVGRIKVTAEGTSFIINKKEALKKDEKTGRPALKVLKAIVTPKVKRRLALQSGLLGRHNVGPLAFAAALALELGLSDEQVMAGIAKTIPYEHRMQPRYMNGALLIDDTYNGNLEGVRAGTALLHELPATRKWYVTPGLVDQGKSTTTIHHHMGELIAAAKPDIVVLMQNSVTAFIEAGLKIADFKGEVRIEPNPLEFYTSLPHFVAAGDIIMMQNDWTDNYK